MTGIEYENWCAQYLRQCGFAQIRKTKATGDQGIDLLARKGGLLFGFQCKYYQSHVGNEAVQQAYAGMKYYGCDKAVVMTNGEFTSSAKDLADETGVVLWDRQDPGTEASPFRFVTLFAFVLLLVSVWLLVNACLGKDESMILLMTAAVLESVFALCSHHSTGCTGLSIISAFLFLTASCFVSGQGTVYEICRIAALLAALLQMMRWTIIRKRNMRVWITRHRKEIRELMHEDLTKIGGKLAEVFSMDFGKTVTVKEAVRHRDGTCEFVFHSAGNTAQLLEDEEKELNEMTQCYELKALSERQFRVRMK
ncbi:MAG: restriction endonuclease [Solobacterium sp.]|nr:restriction endonuclease [Solobacterium sp.]